MSDEKRTETELRIIRDFEDLGVDLVRFSSWLKSQYHAEIDIIKLYNEHHDKIDIIEHKNDLVTVQYVVRLLSKRPDHS